jgi:hypothetical protein
VTEISGSGNNQQNASAVAAEIAFMAAAIVAAQLQQQAGVGVKGCGGSSGNSGYHGGRQQQKWRGQATINKMQQQQRQ